MSDATRRFGAREPGIDYVPRPAAYVVVLDAERRVACVDENSGLFLPGGGIEAGEDPLRAAHREVAEECAHALEIVATLEPAIQFHQTGDGRAFELRASFFVGRFGLRLDREPEHRLHWLAIEPEPPDFHHACHRWAVEQARGGAW